MSASTVMLLVKKMINTSVNDWHANMQQCNNNMIDIMIIQC